jgi:hypothetical protein
MTNSSVRQFVLGLGIAVVMITAVSAHHLQNHPEEPALSLERVYVYEAPKRWTGNLDALLDPDGTFLFVVETGNSGVRARKVDWRSGQIVKEKTYENSGCSWDIRPVWAWIPSTRLIELRFCGFHYILETTTLESERRMQARRYGEGFVFSPTGRIALVSTYDEQRKTFHKALHEVQSWKEISSWDLPGQDEVFSQDGRYMIARLIREEDGRPHVAECGLAFYEVSTGKLASEWLVDPRGHRQESTCWRADNLIPNTAYLALDRILGKGLAVVDLWFGKVIYELEHPDVAIETRPEVSPDGRYVVVGGWNDPEDEEWSRDFIIWNLKTRRIVHQAPRYRSVWGRNTFGREVYPRFSYDGSYLIVAREDSVDLWRIGKSKD